MRKLYLKPWTLAIEVDTDDIASIATTSSYAGPASVRGDKTMNISTGDVSKMSISGDGYYDADAAGYRSTLWE